MSKEEKLRLILNLQLKNEYAIGIICTFVKQILMLIVGVLFIHFIT